MKNSLGQELNPDGSILVPHTATPGQINKAELTFMERARIEAEEQKLRAMGKHLNPDGSLDPGNVAKEKTENPPTNFADGTAKIPEHKEVKAGK